jgi:hypothetical protein
MTKKETTGIFDLKLSNDRHEIAYLRLPNYPKQGIGKVSKSFRLSDIIGGYKGPDVVFDFDQDEELVGIEIITYDGE